MTTWLSEAWFDQARHLAAPFTLTPGLSARIGVEITGGPDGDVSCVWVLNDGRLEDAPAVDGDAPEVTMTMTEPDAVALVVGDLEPSVAFMQGRMKVVGSMAVMIPLLAATRSPHYQELRRSIADITDF
jgi:hypothetical protein